MAKANPDTPRKKPSVSRTEEAILNLMRTADRVELSQARLLREHGLTPAQYNILRILQAEGKPLPCLKIAQRTITLVPGITGLIDRLERSGLVSRQRSETDRRQIFIVITASAIELLDTIDEPLKKLNDQLLSELTREEQAELTRLLGKLQAGPLGPENDGEE